MFTFLRFGQKEEITLEAGVLSSLLLQLLHLLLQPTSCWQASSEPKPSRQAPTEDREM